jgi:hypothetical protein
VPGLDLMIYGAVLVLVIRFAPRGLVGACADMRTYFVRRTKLCPPIGEVARG